MIHRRIGDIHDTMQKGLFHAYPVPFLVLHRISHNTTSPENRQTKEWINVDVLIGLTTGTKNHIPLQEEKHDSKKHVQVKV